MTFRSTDATIHHTKDSKKKIQKSLLLQHFINPLYEETK